MFNECIEIFDEILHRETEDWLIDMYVPVSGTYILIDIEKDFSLRKKVEIKVNKKTGEVEVDNIEYYRLISFLDKNSKLITMNKAVETGKIIHSNNYYAFFVKKESIKEKKLEQKNIDTYYDVLKHPENKYKKPKAKQIYEQVKQKCGEINEETIDEIKNWVSTNLNQFINENNIDTRDKSYLKIFFVYADDEKTKEEIYKEGNRYFLPNIYNNNDYNVEIDDEILGVHNNNMGLNDKKPFLDNKSRKNSVPVLVNMERALKQYQFMEYLSSQAAKGKYNIYIDFDEKDIYCLSDNETLQYSIETGMYLRIRQGKTEVEIFGMERIVGYEPDLKTSFIMKEYFEISENFRKTETQIYGMKTKLKEMEQLVNEVFFGKYLMGNYRTNASDLPTMNMELKELLLQYRERMWIWLHNNDDTEIKQCIGKIGKKLVYNNLEYIEKVKNQFNLWFSLEEYFNNDRRNKESMQDLRDVFETHIMSEENWRFESDKEYYYGVGQISRYLTNLSKSGKKSLDMLRPILNVKTDAKVKERVKEFAKKYDYAIEVRYKKLGELMANILVYQPEGKVDDVMIMAGYVDNNYLYMSSKNKENAE